MNFTVFREREKMQHKEEGEGRCRQCSDQDHGKEVNHFAKVVQVLAKIDSDLKATSTELDRKERS
jgi:hypothetical protein